MRAAALVFAALAIATSTASAQGHGEAGARYYVANSGEPAGVTAGGGVYQLTVDTPATAALNLSMGGNVRVAGPVKLNLALSYGRAFRQYRVTDRVSGRSGPVRPLSLPLGPSIGLVFGF